MNVQRSRILVGLVVALTGFVSQAAWAAPLPVKVNMTNLRCIQNYALPTAEDDAVYLAVNTVAKGTETTRRVPETGKLPANKKKPPVSEDAPIALWEGELGEGEFALVTVTLYHGSGDEPAKAFSAKLADTAKGVAGRGSKTLSSADDAKKLATETVKAQRGIVTAVKDTLSREKKTDHFGGLFNILVWNNNGTLVKRVDPVGLTFGEHAGDDQKIYSKIKHTRDNVPVRDPSGAYYPQTMPPISEDKLTVRVKMLETEKFTKPDGTSATPSKNVTDYLADLHVLVSGKPVEWKLAGAHIGEPGQEFWPAIKMWWDWAE
jgi:hypothetical protein